MLGARIWVWVVFNQHSEGQVLLSTSSFQYSSSIFIVQNAMGVLLAVVSIIHEIKHRSKVYVSAWRFITLAGLLFVQGVAGIVHICLSAIAGAFCDPKKK